MEGKKGGSLKKRIAHLLVGRARWCGKEDHGYLPLIPWDRYHRVAPVTEQVPAGGILWVTLYGCLQVCMCGGGVRDI